MKKLIAMLLVFAMLFGLVGCGAGGNNVEAPKETEKVEGENAPAGAEGNEEIGGYKIGFYYLPDSDLLSAQYRSALKYAAELTNCEVEFFDMLTFSSEELSTAIETLTSNGCDGIVVIYGSSPSMFEYMNQNGVYYCGMTRSYTDEVALVTDNSEFCCGWLDENAGLNFAMGYGVTAELAKSGCKNIAYLGGEIDGSAGDERVAGIEAAAADYGMNIVTSYRGYDYATGFSDILSTYGSEIDGIVSNSTGETGIAAINSAGYSDTIKYAQIDNCGPYTKDYLESGHLVATTAGNNVFILLMYMQLFNAISGADRLYQDEKLLPIQPNFVVSSAEEWEAAEKYVMDQIPGMTPEELLALCSYYAPDTSVEEKEALMQTYCSDEYWNIELITQRVKAYLGE